MNDHFQSLYEKYLSERAGRFSSPILPLEEFRKLLAGSEHISLSDQRFGDGALYYSVWQENGMQICDIPVYGYYASSEKALSMLFTALSEKVLRISSTFFQIHIYAHDVSAQRLFSMLQFGYMAEKGMLRISDLNTPSNGRWTIRTLSRADIEKNWDTLWEMTHGIICHLQKAPVFYPGAEFTEAVYKEFYLDEATSVHAAYTSDNRIIGMIESNRETAWFAGSNSANVGEAYVIPELRGSGAAGELLSYAASYEKNRGAEYLWVEHGTANPEGRGFWNKYFQTYQYEMVRKIDPI